MDEQAYHNASTSVEVQSKAYYTTDDELMPADVDAEQALKALHTSPMERVPTYLQPRLAFRQRLQHFTFAWYTVS